MSNLLKTSFTVLLCVTATISAKAQGVVYQSDYLFPNNTVYQIPVASGVETGDQVNLGGTERVMTGFSFGYLASGLNSGATAQVSFYDATGVPADISSGINKTTTTLLWQTAQLSVQDTTTGTMLNFYASDLNNGINVPDNLIWTVTFNYSSGASVPPISLLAGHPSVGGGYDQYFTYDGTAWQPKDVAGVPSGGAHFVATITAVPEPSTFALLGLGGFASMVLIRRRK